jgi:hypothetical protein
VLSFSKQAYVIVAIVQEKFGSQFYRFSSSVKTNTDKIE